MTLNVLMFPMFEITFVNIVKGCYFVLEKSCIIKEFDFSMRHCESEVCFVPN